MYSGTSPLLMLDQDYLIYAKRPSEREKRWLKQSDPFIYCGGRSSQILNSTYKYKEYKSRTATS